MVPCSAVGPPLWRAPLGTHWTKRTDDERGKGRPANIGISPSSAAGGGFAGGNVVGATDKKAERGVHKFYKVESFGGTLYQLLGMRSAQQVYTPNHRASKPIARAAPTMTEARCEC